MKRIEIEFYEEKSHWMQLHERSHSSIYVRGKEKKQTNYVVKSNSRKFVTAQNISTMTFSHQNWNQIQFNLFLAIRMWHCIRSGDFFLKVKEHRIKMIGLHIIDFLLIYWTTIWWWIRQLIIDLKTLPISFQWFFLFLQIQSKSLNELLRDRNL